MRVSPQLVFPNYIREKAIKERGRKCENCGRAGFVFAHHILPVSKGGSHKIENLKLLCQDCHDLAHGRTHKKRFDGERPDAWIGDPSCWIARDQEAALDAKQPAVGE